MPMSPEKKQQITDDLMRGVSISRISDNLDVPIGTINGIRAELKSNAINSAADNVTIIEPEVIRGVAAQLTDNGLHKAAKEARALAESVGLLQKFHPKLITAANALLDKVNTKMLDPKLSVRELKDIADIITKLNGSFFSSNVSNTLIQINNSDEVNMQAKTELLRMREERLKQLQGGRNE